MRTRHSVITTPIGEVTVVTDARAISRIMLHDQRHLPAHVDIGERDDTTGRDAAAQLAEYFAGERRSFELDLAPCGTPFQLALWRELAEVPFGELVTYSDLARAIGRPSATRAVAMANARNPMAVVWPCHRVVGADGTLTGYAGGLEVKAWLLEHEGHRVVSRGPVAARSVVVAGEPALITG